MTIKLYILGSNLSKINFIAPTQRLVKRQATCARLETMKLCKALQLHKIHRQKKGLGQSLGDTYLLNHNPVYKNIRVYSNGLGFRFTKAWNEYWQAPLLQIENIKKRKLIPFNGQVPFLEKIENSYPRYFRTNRIPFFIKSYHYHESAHLIAGEVLHFFSPQTNDEKILKMLIEESFANAVEAYATGFAKYPAHQFFLETNSYQEQVAVAFKFQKRARILLGTRNAFLMNFYAFLYANFLIKSVSRNGLAELLAVIDSNLKTTPAVYKSCAEMMNAANTLSLNFRYQTADFSFKQMGIRTSVLKALDFDFMKKITSNLDLLFAIEKLASIATKEN
jgi:hypothetical protein